MARNGNCGATLYCGIEGRPAPLETYWLGSKCQVVSTAAFPKVALIAKLTFRKPNPERIALTYTHTSTDASVILYRAH